MTYVSAQKTISFWVPWTITPELEVLQYLTGEPSLVLRVNRFDPFLITVKFSNTIIPKVRSVNR